MIRDIELGICIASSFRMNWLPCQLLFQCIFIDHYLFHIHILLFSYSYITFFHIYILTYYHTVPYMVPQSSAVILQIYFFKT